ncbi:cell wall hydrolase [Peribacillus simplex]|uniref:Spore cortex-lytic enzyme n=1 Tax=Peribacillus simplex TaxID=1478 RepID=A0A9W4PDL3_9BACI|nr:cell wall hydrolase [Peribacillus simplex]MDR4926076.1 cell wall hydrolase [Peribacillus simplex]WHX89292.1 cell wall hydrolase [Peribacillus simplex]CAH0196094.1 Spore cortex-lytic enzyme [Peribacillus simplex]
MKLSVLITVIMTLSVIVLGIAFPKGTTSIASDGATKHVIKQGESIWDIAKQYGVPIKKLKEVNNNINNVAEPGKTLIIPHVMNEKDKELLARLVHAEAKGEPYRGKVEVAGVVLNRLDSKEFPDTVREVIYQKNQFSPVGDGSINKPAGDDAKKAVNEALAIHGYTNDALYFWNPSISDSEWMKQLEVIKIIGGHHFAI